MIFEFSVATGPCSMDTSSMRLCAAYAIQTDTNMWSATGT